MQIGTAFAKRALPDLVVAEQPEITPHTSPADTHTRIPSADGNDTPPSCD
jgi:hypothetical protein